MATKSTPDNAGVIMFLPLLYLLTLSIGLLLSYFSPMPLWPKSIRLPVGVLLIALAVGVLVMATRRLRQYKTTINPAGATTVIVSDGIFRFTHNPMYVSFTLIFLGTSTLASAWVSFLLISPLLVIVQKGIIEREERYLTQKFGGAYLSYKARVRRWF